MSQTLAARYLRQSQALNDDVAAVQRQADATSQVAEAKGLSIVETYTDNDFSATSSKPRPAYQQMIQNWRAGKFRAIVAYDLDRLYRLPRELEDLIDLAEKEGLMLFTASGDADLSTDGGRLFARIKAAVAKGEVERKSARQRLRNAQDAAAGKPYWRRRPFGYELDGSLRPEEADAVRWAYATMLSGGGLATVRQGWAARGLTTPAYERVGGNAWTLAAVRQLLHSPRNAAIRAYKGEELPGSWEPIVDEVTWRTVVARMKEKASGLRKPSGAPENLLSGIAKCGYEGCGAPMWTTRDMKGNRRYRCSVATHLSRRADICDARVSGWIVATLTGPGAHDLLVNDKSPDSKALEVERDGIRAKINRLRKDYYEDSDESLVDEAYFRTATKALQERLRLLEGQMVRQDRVPLLGGLLKAPNIRAMWESDDYGLSRRRAVVDSLTVVTILGGRGEPVQIDARKD